MKKILITLLIFSIFLTIPGCSKENIQEESETTLMQSEVTLLSDEQVDSIYQKALKIYYWFDVGTLPADIEEKTVVKERTYYKVTSEFTAYQELIDMMDSVFDDKIVKNLLSRNMYIDVDGDLYGVLGDRGTDIHKGAASYEIIRKNDKEIVYKATVEVLDDEGHVTGYETYDFSLKFYDDGKWRFEEFYLFR